MKRWSVKARQRGYYEGQNFIARHGCESLRETVELTNECANLADAALVVTPSYYIKR